MNSCSPISAFVMPRATERTMSSSRSVRAVVGSRDDGRVGPFAEVLEEAHGDRRRNEGVTGGGGADCLDEQGGTGVLEQEAAGAVANRRVDVLVVVERRDDDDRDRVRRRPYPPAGVSLRARRAAACECRRGTTSGRRRRARSTASRPSVASPSTSMPWASRIRRMPERTISWSSAMTTRSGTVTAGRLPTRR